MTRTRLELGHRRRAAGAAGLDGTSARRREGRGREPKCDRRGLSYKPRGNLGFILNAMKNYRIVFKYLGFKQIALVPGCADRGKVETGRSVRR